MAFLEQLFEDIKKDVVIFKDRTVTVRSLSVDYDEKTVDLALECTAFDTVCMTYTDACIKNRFEGYDVKIARSFAPECFCEDAFFWLLDYMGENRTLFRNCFSGSTLKRSGDSAVVTVNVGTVQTLRDFDFVRKFNTQCIAFFGRGIKIEFEERAPSRQEIVSAAQNAEMLL